MKRSVLTVTLVNGVEKEKRTNKAVDSFMELLTGFEPVTSSLPRTCSTC